MNLYESLGQIQAELKAPKGQFNDFGKYKYRSCEDILEAVKPLLKKYGLFMTISDRMVEVGGRIYVEACATLFGIDNPKEIPQISVTAYAREEESKKGMDASQVTGAASSYARKYALNGLFCIDDNKDADATNTGDKPAQKPRPVEPTPDGDFQPVCADCGREIDVRTHDYSVKYYKRPLCINCQKSIARKNASENR